MWAEQMKHDIKVFHRQRRMFFVNRHLFIAPEHDSRSHADWIMDVYKVEEPQLRGYVDPTGLYIYNTHDCRSSEQAWLQFLPYLDKLRRELKLDRNVQIWNGTIPGEPGERWKGEQSKGTIGDWV
jgi:hypothetical protein